MKFGVVTFPGSNCDHDCYHVCKHVAKSDVNYLWYKDRDLQNCDCIVLPGGFSYGDYLRCGAIARFAPIMEEVISFAHKGGMVIGICNGFQVLTESGLLPGALIRNESLKFICKDVYLKVENRKSAFTANIDSEVIKVPIAHGEGQFVGDADLIERLENEGRVAFRYCNADGHIHDEDNPNGSINNIAGILNAEGNVLGMMPHPERCAEDILGNIDGKGVFDSIVTHFRK